MGRKNNMDLEEKVQSKIMEVSREVLSVRKSMDQFTDMKKRLDLVNSALEKNVTAENFE
jgi:hypothetical protein